FAIYLSETLPPTTENFPPIGLFVIFNVTFVAVVLLCNVVTTCLYYKGDQRVPDWALSVVLS
uniref:Uncharacterized protein n=1 Tax=Romanomermis culicivorax TaxID=13658 RepID=A0A915JZH9_ROMCU